MLSTCQKGTAFCATNANGDQISQKIRTKAEIDTATLTPRLQ